MPMTASRSLVKVVTMKVQAQLKAVQIAADVDLASKEKNSPLITQGMGPTLKKMTQILVPNTPYSIAAANLLLITVTPIHDSS